MAKQRYADYAALFMFGKSNSPPSFLGEQVIARQQMTGMRPLQRLDASVTYVTPVHCQSLAGGA
jgi:hypothetical protein